MTATSSNEATGGSSAERRRVLVVDDEPGIRDSLRLLLQSSFEVKTVADGSFVLQEAETFAPDLILMDVMMPQQDGVQTLRLLKHSGVQAPVVMLTAAGEVKTAVEAMKLGAADYLNKPFDVTELTSVILQHLGSATCPPVKAEGTTSIGASPGDFGALVGRTEGMQELYRMITQVAARETTVLITGESGTGKELVAREIHARSSRASGKFVALNCAAIPETLIESELFGHERGAFTNAVEKRIGHCELADGGTLFLDEIGELSLAVQVKLLRFLQEQEFYRVGSSKPLKVNVRIVTATNRNLEQLVAEGKFREDLFYRIHVINLHIPPLRDRFEDIALLTEHFGNIFAKRYRPAGSFAYEPEAKAVLQEYSWPGNVRELENVIEGLYALYDKELIAAADLPRKLFTRPTRDAFKQTMIVDGDLKFNDAERVFESEMIIKALKKAGYVQTRAAEILGISRRILKYKMDKLGISDKPVTPDA